MWWHWEESEEGIREQSIWELIPKVVPLFRAHSRYLFAAFGLLILITLSNLAGPLVIRYVFDVSIPASDSKGVLIAAGIYILIASGGAAVGYFQAITLFKLGINIITDLKARMFEHVLNLGLDFHGENPPGKLLSRVESDAETLKQLFSDVAVNLLRNFLFFAGILIVLSVLDFGIAVYILLLVPLLFVATFVFLTKMRRYWRELRAQWAKIMIYVTEYVQGIEVIQQYNYQETAKRRMRDVNLGQYKVQVPAFYLEYGFWGAFMYGEIVAIIIVLVVGVGRVFDGTLSIGTLIAFIEYIRQMFWPLIELSGQLGFVQRGLVSVERVFGILEIEPSIKDGTLEVDKISFEEEIRFENVSFAYEEEEWVLSDVSFEIKKGEKVALVGASGGGKSTIVNLLLRFYDPQKGRITVDGEDIRSFPLKQWRERIGLVLQDIFLFPGSVADNIRVFDDEISLDRVKEVSRVAHAEGIIEKLSGKYDGELSEGGANLSVGERQLISFARALACDPPLLVLDEATSSVDPYTERLVQEALERLLSGRTAVIVAHRLSTIENADKILLIKDGRVEESGRHDELLKINGLYAKLHRLQFTDLAARAEGGGER